MTVKVRRVKGPWHPAGTTPLEELTLVKNQLERGVLPFPGEALVSCALLVTLCVADAVKGQSLAFNGSLVLAAAALSGWLVRRYRRSRLEWLRAKEALNHYEARSWKKHE